MAYGYDKKVDYTKLINEDIARQDYRSAAIHEAQRNEKVRGEGLTQYQTTNHYSDYLPRTEQINSGMDQLARQEQWHYDADRDPSAQAYRKSLLREADRQTEDTLGRYAGMTGGRPSTAAVQAASQAGNYMRAQYADKIPELMQADYNRYITNKEQGRADLQLLASLDRQQAQDSLELQQWDYQKQQQEIQNAMNRWSVLGAADNYVAQILGVPVGTSTQDASYQQWQQQMQQEQWSWQKQQTERSDAYERALRYISVGQMPDAATMQAAGLSAADVQRLVNYYKQQQTVGGNGGGSSNGGHSYTPRRPAGPTVDPKKESPGSNLQPLDNDSLARAATMLADGSTLGEVATWLANNFDGSIYDLDAALAWAVKNRERYKRTPGINPIINYDMYT